MLCKALSNRTLLLPKIAIMSDFEKSNDKLYLHGQAKATQKVNKCALWIGNLMCPLTTSGAVCG